MISISGVPMVDHAHKPITIALLILAIIRLLLYKLYMYMHDCIILCYNVRIKLWVHVCTAEQYNIIIAINFV